MPISIDKILSKTPHQYFKDSKKILDYTAKAVNYVHYSVNKDFPRFSKYGLKAKFAENVPDNAKVVLEFKCFEEYNPQMAFGVALIPRK